MKFLSVFLFLSVLSIATASPPQARASTGRPSADCVQSLRSRPSLKKVRQAVKNLEHTYTVRMGNHYPRILHPNGRFVLSSDFEPFECRTCRQGVPVLLPLLKEIFPQISWAVMESTETVDGHFQHAYIIARDFFGKEQPLIIDYSLRQFFEPPLIDQVPRIFVGSAKELSRLLDLSGFPQAVQKYLNAVKIED